MSIDAIPFTLFGTTSKGAKGDDVVNNVVGKNCKTWVKFKVDDIQYLVTRYHQYTKFGNTVVINENGVDIKQGHKECLPFIERIVCPQKAFMNALMFGQKVKDFFTDLPDAQKKDIFRKVLDLEMFLVYYKHADQALKEIIEKRAEKEQRNMINAGLLQDTKEQIQLLKQAKIEFGKQKEERIKEKKKAIEESARLLSHWRKSVDELKTKDMNLEETISALATIEKTIQDLSKTFEMKLNDLTQQKIAKINEIAVKAFSPPLLKPVYE
jgi:DNA repair exonuclease SbcCD ATPase subunit